VQNPISGSITHKLELIALFAGNLAACVVGVSAQYDYPFGSPAYFDLMAWPVVAIPSILFSFGSSVLYYRLRNDPKKWLLFLVSLLVQLILGSLVGRMTDF